MILVCLMEFSQARGHLSNSKVEKLSLTKVVAKMNMRYLGGTTNTIYWVCSVGREKSKAGGDFLKRNI